MRICIVSLNIVPFYQGDNERAFGGAEVQTTFLAHTFREGNHEVKMVVADLSPSESIPYEAGRQFHIIAGVMSREPELDTRIRREAEALTNVTLEGRLPRDEVQRRIRGASLLINTSRFEGFPNAYLEAWNHGVPVVTMNDVDDLIRDNGVGLVCTTPEEMVAAIASFDGNPVRLREMGQRARALVQERFSPAAIGRQYMEFFEMLHRPDRDGARK